MMTHINAVIFPPGMRFVTIFVLVAVKARRTPAGNHSVDIISSYKPVLRNAVKINFRITASRRHFPVGSDLQRSIPEPDLMLISL